MNTIHKNHICKSCDKSFPRLNRLNSHIKSVHEGLKTKTCDICSKCFFNQGALNVHMIYSHKELGIYKCEYCDKDFGLDQYLKNHIKNTHKEIHNEQKCSFCQKTWKQDVKFQVRLL